MLIATYFLFVFPGIFFYDIAHIPLRDSIFSSPPFSKNCNILNKNSAEIFSFSVDIFMQINYVISYFLFLDILNILLLIFY